MKIKAVPLSSWELEFAKNDSREELLEMMDSHSINLGLEFSGVVESDGEKFKKGDRVVGSIDFVKEEKAMCEYIPVNENYLAHLPNNISFVEGASLPISAETAYRALIELANIKPNMNVLIIGANGGLGVYATQLSKIYGANTTTIGGKESLEKMKKLGANKTYAYTETKLEDLEEKYDIILDFAKALKFEKAQHMLNDYGVFVNSNPQLDEEATEIVKATNKKVPYLFVAHGTREILTKIVELVTKDKIIPMVESVYSINEYKEAFNNLVSKARFGKVIVDFEKND